MANTDVSEMVNLCRGLGLQVSFETGSTHYAVRDPDSNAKLFYISSTPSDSNFKYEIARHLRRLGLLTGNLKFGKFKTIKRKKKYGPIDMVALRKAQAQAESAGERIPLLEDIDGDNTFLRKTISRVNQGTSTQDHGYVKEAQQEAIENMPVKATPRSYATKQRLRKTLLEKNMSKSEFARATMEVAEKRDLRGWKSHKMALVAINKFADDDDSTMMIWGINLVEATLDHVEGLKWGEIDETRRVSGAMDSNAANDMAAARQEPIDDPAEVVKELEAQFITEETLLNILENFRVQIEKQINEVMRSTHVTSDNTLRDKYADVLLELLKNDQVTDKDFVMKRLDKMVGLEA